MRISNPRSSVFPQLNSFLVIEEDFWERVKMNQVHAHHVAILTDPWQIVGDADGVVTQLKDLILSVRVADCGNLYFFDPLAEVIGICHAGWRGTAQGVVSETLIAMKKLWSQTQDIYVFAWPAICWSCHQFTKHTEGLFDDKYYEEGMLNLRSVWKDQLLDWGVILDKIVISPMCTMCESEFHSFKRDGTEKRMIGTICLKS